MNKKSQLEIMQTIMIVIVIVIVLIIAAVMFFSMQVNNLKKTRDQQDLFFTVKKAQVINALPEIKCSFEGIIKPDCFDIIKVRYFAEEINKSYEHYIGELGFANITLINYDLDNSVNIYDHVKEDYTNLHNIQFPVILYNPVIDKEYIGVMMIEMYS